MQNIIKAAVDKFISLSAEEQKKLVEEVLSDFSDSNVEDIYIVGSVVDLEILKDFKIKI